MRIQPSVVIGLGSSGAYVVASLERILYEVMGDARLDLFKLIAVDTDSRPKEEEPPPGGRHSLRFPANEPNTSQAIKNLRQTLREDFNWCPGDLELEEGAGNRRAGGRMLLFNKFPQIWHTIQRSVHDVCNAAAHGDTRQVFERKFAERGMAADAALIKPDEPVVYVVGTLAGGTCSGMCLDLGYAIADAAPNASRIATFFLPARTDSSVYLENAWATLKDLEFFCDNPSSFRTVWCSQEGATQRYQANNLLPYEWVYLLSASDEMSALKMRYEPNSHSPLVQMTALQLACALFGTESHIAARHVDAGEQIGCRPKNRFFFNYNLRAVTYPKYDLSEAAACRIVENFVCGGWLNEEGYHTAAGAKPMNAEAISSEGRKLWNERFRNVWPGLWHDVKLNEWVDRILKGTSTDPHAELHYQLTAAAPGTIHSQVYQTLANCRNEIKKFIRQGLGDVYSSAQNLRYAELYAKGIRSELAYTERFWNLVGTGNRNDSNTWSTLATQLVEHALSTASATSLLLGARKDVLTDELTKVVTRLQMYLMKQVLADVKTWMDGDLAVWMKSLREMIQFVKNLASSRATTLKAQLDERVGPVLKISRSKSETLRGEMEKLALEPVRPDTALLRAVDGEFQGLFAVKQRQEISDNRNIFLKLKSELQPPLLRHLEAYGAINVAEEVRNQGRITQVADHFRDAQAMSIATKIGLVKSPSRVPSFLLAKDNPTAELLLRELTDALGQPPQIAYQPLPLLDHTIVFYQEGACSVAANAEYHAFPDVLTDADTYAEHWAIKMKDRPDILDPLGSIKSPSASAVSGGTK